MKCKILHESKGRLRVHLFCGKMSLDNADVLEYYLRAVNGVTDVSVYDRTCDAVIVFTERKAVLKALGTGFSQGVGRKDVSVTRDKLGKPKALLSGRALEIAQELGVVEVALSITLTGDLAVANAIAITEDARPKPKDEKVSTKKRVAQTFKEARSVLDELEQLQNSALTEHLGDASQDTLGA